MKKFNLPYKNLILYIFDRADETDYKFIQNHAQEIFDIFVTSYENIGGCGVYSSPRNMRKSVDRYKLVMTSDLQIVAQGVYVKDEHFDSYKSVLIAGNKAFSPDLYKSGVKFIIKSDIVNFSHLYWSEASGPIGHWRKKYGAIMLPFATARSILQISRPNIEIYPVENNDFAYMRKIVGVDEPVEKIMFGFPSIEIFNQMLKDDGYDRYMKEIRDAFGPDAELFDLLKEDLKRISDKRYIKSIFYSLFIIVGSYQEENMFYNMLPKTYQALHYLVDEAFKILRRSHNILNREDRIRYRDLYDLSKDILLNANILEPHKLF